MATSTQEILLRVRGDSTSAQRALKSVDTATGKLSGMWKKHGAAIGVAAGVALAAVVRFASQSIEAYKNQATANLKLQNTLQNMPKLAGENEDSFYRLANAIQRTTAVEDDASIAGLAMLGTFEMTGDEMREMLPLIADYSRKFGVDMVEAAKQVGKAYMGQIGALQRNGVTIDKVAYKTDRYSAIMNALRDQVGGFAEQEAKAGLVASEQLANAWGDLQEAFGEGLIGEQAEQMDNLTDALYQMQPAAEAAGGAISATLGTLMDGVYNINEAIMWFERTLGGMNVTRKTIWDEWIDSNADATMSFYEFEDAVLAGEIAVDGLYVSAGATTDATDDMTGAIGGAVSAVEDSEGAAEEAASAFDKWTRAMDGTITAAGTLDGVVRGLTEMEWDAELAAIAAREAEQRYAEVMADSASTSDDIAEARIRMEQASLRAKDAQVDLGNATASAQEAFDEAAADPAYLRWLMDARDRARELRDALGSVSDLSNRVASTPTGNTRGVTKYGAGGIVDGPEYALVGERDAREYVITTEGAYRSRSLQLFAQLANDLGVRTPVMPTFGSVGGGKSGSTYTINVTANSAADIPAIRAAVDESLRTYVRTSTVLGRA